MIKPTRINADTNLEELLQASLVGDLLRMDWSYLESLEPLELTPEDDPDLIPEDDEDDIEFDDTEDDEDEDDDDLIEE